ncbi:hypothetical protein [Tengunoibacter tsumagoiensis]|uniref:Uncharacterized protein n=1 Tax=Tengunoibacter tsumagoiensis TaxID=2014871 RepID=A0A402A662_9CHLR|nr:hypothetical protein [Tengunoibacter tsumagoiensis]GCE14620.1 hypothetical protein KTT_44790 [Tengunoibacter tsumagoiensis]
MHTTTALSTISRIIKIIVIVLLLFLIAFDIAPTSSERDTQQYIVEAGFQRARSQQIEKAGYILLYRPQEERVQAHYELQEALNALQQEMNLLQKNTDPDVQGNLQGSQVDYFALIVASQALLDHPDDPANSIEFNIILLHDRPFFASITNLVTILQQHASARMVQLLSIRIIIIVLCFIVCIFLILLDRYIYAMKEVHLPFIETLPTSRKLWAVFYASFFQAGKTGELVFLLNRFFSVLALCSLLFLIWFEIVPTSSQRDEQYIVNTGFQRERERIFENSAYSLRYRSTSDNIQAISDLQTTLILFRQEQSVLFTNPDPAVQRYLQTTQADYQALVQNIQILADHPNNVVTPIQFENILLHGQRFFVPMNDLVTYLKNQQQASDEQFMLDKIIIEGSCGVLILLLIFL